MNQGLSEDDFNGINDSIKTKGDTFGKIKVLGFVIVFALIVIMFLNK